MLGEKTGSPCTGTMKADKPSNTCCLPSIAANPLGLSQQLIDVNACTEPPETLSLSGGWFRMGADDGSHPADGEGPAREVFVDEFKLAPTAVTVRDFAHFVHATGYQSLAEQLGSSLVFFAFTDRSQA